MSDNALSVKVDVTHELMPVLASAVVDELLSRGLAMAPPARTRPYSVAEAADALGVGEGTVRRDVDDGRLSRVMGTNRVLIPAWSVEQRRDGGDGGVKTEKSNKGK